MPVSGNEEMGVKASVGQFSEYSAGIPIKKRRFPFISSHSQLTEDSPLLPTENESEQKGFSCLLQGSTVSNDSVVTASSNPRYVLASLNTSGVVASSNTSTIYADGIAASLNATSSAASSNASGAAVSSTVVSVAASLSAGSVAASSNASSVATSSNTNSVAARLNVGSLAASSNAFGVATSSTAINVAASLNAGSFAASSNAFSVATSSTAISVAASSNACSVAASSNASGVAMSSTAISVAASSNAIRAVENPDASSVAASVSGFSDASEKIVPEKVNRISVHTNGSKVHCNSNLLRVKLEEQSFMVHSRSLADIDSNGKPVATGESDNILRKSAKSELDLVGNDSLTLNLGKDMHSQQNTDGQCILQLPLVFGNPGLSLGLMEYLSDMASRNNEHGFQNQEKAEPVSLNLSLSKGECSTQLRSTDVNPNPNAANMLPDRTNWDLNTTMDSWEGRATDDAARQTTTHVDDIKMSIYSSGITAISRPIERKMLEEIGCRANIEISSMLSSQQYGTVDSLCLGLTVPYLHLNSNEQPSSSSAKVDSCKFVANISSPGETTPVSKLTMVNIKPVKLEPLDESFKTNSAEVKAKLMGFLNCTKVKCELVENCSSESSKSSTLSPLNLVDARSVKPEAVHEGNHEIPKRMEGSLNQSDEQMLRPLDTPTGPTSTGLSLHGDASTYREHFIQDKEIEPSGEAQIASNMISSVGYNVNQLNIFGKIDNSTSQKKNAEDPHQCKLKFMDVQLPDLRGTVEGSVSDEEKIKLSGDILEEDPYGSDYEWDDNRELSAGMDMEHDGRADDFEDGEVREAIENTEVEVPICERRKAGNGDDGDIGYRNSDFIEFVGDNNPSSSFIKEKDTQREDLDEPSSDNIDECIDTSVSKDSITKAYKDICLQDSSVFEMPSSQTDKKRPIKAMPRKSLNVSEKKDTIKGQEGEHTPIQASDTRQGTPVSVAQGADDAKKSDSEGISNSVLSTAEAFLNGDDPSNDVNKGDKRSQIINLSQACNLSSRGRTRPISGKTLQSQVGGEKLPDVALEGDKFHHRGRDEAFGDGSHRSSRERHHDQPYRNNRISFMRGRGRISSRVETLRADRDSECNFASDFNGPKEFRVVRHKYASGVSDADRKFSGYNNGQDGAYFGTGRSRRKILSDDSSIFPRLPLRRQSPGGRDGLAARRLPMVRRGPGNLNPNRCIGEDGSELVGFRHMRGFADDDTDRMLAHCQPSFEGLDGPLDRGNRELSSVQRMGFTRTHSKSPTRPRSSLRRSLDGFGGPLELPHQRSLPIYRMKRIRSPDIRSPDRPCFAGEMALKRHGSPPYFSRPSNDLRVLDSGQDHGHPRSGIPNRSPSGRILLRNNRRLDLVDPRERNDGDNYFGRTMPSGRLHELGTDGNVDESRSYVNRRGPVCPFRSPYSSADGESFHLNAEGGPRSFMFCSEDVLDLHERGNMREREFDRRIKNQPGNAPRRTRNIEEREGNFRHSGQVWRDEGYR